MSTQTQTILIIGGTRGIGFEVAKSISKQNHRSFTNLAIFGLIDDSDTSNIKSIDDASFKSFLSISGDVTDKESRESAVKTCVDQLGGIDTLIYTAGIITPIERIEKFGVEAVKKSFDINVFGAMAVVRRDVNTAVCRNI